jgi:hypothetical protein
MDAANVNFEQDPETLARELAEDLSGEFGAEILAETEKQLDPAQQGKRALGFGVSEAAAAASLLIGCVQLVWQYYSDKKMDNLLARLEAEAPKPQKVSEEKRSSIIRKVAEKFTGTPGS